MARAKAAGARCRTKAHSAPLAEPMAVATAAVSAQQRVSAAPELMLGPELTIREAAEQRARLLLMLEAGRDRIDASALRTVDTAGLQLLLAASLAARSRGRRLTFAAAGGLMQSAGALGLAEQLGAVAEVVS